MAEDAFEAATYRKIAWRLLPLLFIGYFLAMVDRVNVGFAKLQMAGDLSLSDEVYGFGAGIFFVGYFLEFPHRSWEEGTMLEWLVAITALLLFLVLLPRMLRCTKAASRKSGGSGVWIGIGLAFAMVFDPKASQTIELIDRKQDESEAEESGDRP